MTTLQIHLPSKLDARPQPSQIVPTAAERDVVDAAQGRLLDNPEDADALFALAAWHSIEAEPEQAMTLINRLVSGRPSYPGVWWLRAQVLRDLGRVEDALACERIARLYAEGDPPAAVRPLGSLLLRR